MSLPGDDTIAHDGLIAVGAAHNPGAPDGMGVLEARFVREAGAQQLALWLPQPGHRGYTVLRVRGPADRVLDHAPLSERLDGSVKIVFDTLPWPAGEYRIEILHEAGWRHEIALRKLEPGVPLMAAPSPAEPAVAHDSVPASPSYVDGLGRPIADEDLLLRERIGRDLQRKLSRRVELQSQGRAGVVIYSDDTRRVSFDLEPARRPVRYVIDIPHARAWLDATGIALDEREPTVQFIAERACHLLGAERAEVDAAEIRIY